MLSLVLLVSLAIRPDPVLASTVVVTQAAPDTSFESLIGPPSTRFT